MEPMAHYSPLASSPCGFTLVSPQNDPLHRSFTDIYSVIMLGVRLCLYDEYRAMSPNEAFARTSRDSRDTLLDEICCLVRHFRTQHGLCHAPLMMVYILSISLHVIDQTPVGSDPRLPNPLDPRRDVLMKYLEECSSAFDLAAQILMRFKSSTETKRADLSEPSVPIDQIELQSLPMMDMDSQVCNMPTHSTARC